MYLRIKNDIQPLILSAHIQKKSLPVPHLVGDESDEVNPAGSIANNAVRKIEGALGSIESFTLIKNPG